MLKEEDFKMLNSSFKLQKHLSKALKEAIKFNNTYRLKEEEVVVTKDEVLQRLIISYIADYYKYKRELEREYKLL